MKTTLEIDQDHLAPTSLLDTKRIWLISLTSGTLLWLLGLALWQQQRIDENILFYFDAMRVAHAPLVVLSQWLTTYGMAAITGIFVTYLLVSQKWKSLDAPLTYYFYTICSLGLSGIAGDLLKEVFSRPRPITTFGSEILILSQSVTPAMPSGHATKSIALILPFILLASGSNKLHKAIKVILVTLALGVCFSRIVLGAHYVSDVIAGMGMAAIGLPFSVIFANMIFQQTKAEQLPFLSGIWGILLIFLTVLFMNI